MPIDIHFNIICQIEYKKGDEVKWKFALTHDLSGLTVPLFSFSVLASGTLNTLKKAKMNYNGCIAGGFSHSCAENVAAKPAVSQKYLSNLRTDALVTFWQDIAVDVLPEPEACGKAGTICSIMIKVKLDLRLAL